MSGQKKLIVYYDLETSPLQNTEKFEFIKYDETNTFVDGECGALFQLQNGKAVNVSHYFIHGTENVGQKILELIKKPCPLHFIQYDENSKEKYVFKNKYSLLDLLNSLYLRNVENYSSLFSQLTVQKNISSSDYTFIAVSMYIKKLELDSLKNITNNEESPISKGYIKKNFKDTGSLYFITTIPDNINLDKKTSNFLHAQYKMYFEALKEKQLKGYDNFENLTWVVFYNDKNKKYEISKSPEKNLHYIGLSTRI
jgi:hypothetical protein